MDGVPRRDTVLKTQKRKSKPLLRPKTFIPYFRCTKFEL